MLKNFGVFVMVLALFTPVAVPRLSDSYRVVAPAALAGIVKLTANSTSKDDDKKRHS